MASEPLPTDHLGPTHLQTFQERISRENPLPQDLYNLCFSNASLYCALHRPENLSSFLYLLHTYHSPSWPPPENTLLSAADNGCLEVASELTRYFPDCLSIVGAEWRLLSRCTQFHAALRHDRYDYIVFMLEQGADLGAANALAVEDIVVAAIRHAKSEEQALNRTRFIVDRAGTTVLGSGALRCAARRGYLSVAEYLFGKSGDVEDARLVGDHVQSRKSALTEAARGGSVEVVRFLLEKGADVGMRTEGGVERAHGTAGELAEMGGYAEAARMIGEWGRRGEGKG